MRKRPFSVDWQMVESEEEWQALSTRDLAETESRQQAATHRWLVSLLLLVGAIAGLWYWQQSTLMSEEVYGATPVAQENTDVSSSDNARLAAVAAATPLPDPLSPEMIRMIKRPESGIHAYQKAPPEVQELLTVSLWGRQRSLETVYFDIRFRERDEETVAMAAAQLDPLYLTLRQNWGLPLTAPTQKLTVQISERYVQPDGPFQPQFVNPISVSSPALYPNIASWETTDLFVQSVALALVDHVMAEAMARYGIGTARDPLLDGIRLWQLWDLALPLADKETVLVRWIFQDLPQIQPAEPVPLPADYDEFCTHYTLWMVHPAQLRIPLLCDKLDQTPNRRTRTLLQQPPTTLPWLNMPYYLDHELDGQGRPQATIHPGEAIALATVVDYIDSAYGRAQLPNFLASIQRYNSWDELLPATFSTTKDEFEMAWQQHVVQVMGE